MNTASLDYFLKIFGEQYPLSHALWRVFEATALSEVTLKGPLLDLGCGDGFFLETLLGAPREGVSGRENAQPITGIDLFAPVCEKARARGLYARVDAADARHMPYADQSFQSVFSNSVIEHIPNVDEVIKEVARVLKPGGVFLFSAPTDTLGNYFFWSQFGTRVAMNRFAKWYGNKVNNTFAHHNLFSPEEWTKRLEAQGFKVERAQFTLATTSEKLWDLFLPFSYIQRGIKNMLNLTTIPFVGLNKKLIARFVAKCAAAEERGEHGGNNVIVARRV